MMYSARHEATFDQYRVELFDSGRPSAGGENSVCAKKDWNQASTPKPTNNSSKVQPQPLKAPLIK